MRRSFKSRLFAALLSTALGLVPTLAHATAPSADEMGPPLPPASLATEIEVLKHEAIELQTKAKELEASVISRHRDGSRVARARGNAPESADSTDSADSEATTENRNNASETSIAPH